MMTHRPAGRLPLRAAAWGFAALLVAALPVAAQGRSSHGGGGGGGRSAHSTGSSHSGAPGAPHSGGGRSAHQVPGGGSHGGHDGDHGGHEGWHGGHGGWHGGGGYYYPGWGWGFFPSFSWWYDDPYYYPYYRDYGYGYGGYGGYGYDRYDRGNMGALDLDVSPGRTHVFVNGEDLGIVDRYDGWPGYLWLPRGTYDIAFYLDGYKTISRQVTVYPGTVMDFDDRMEQGPSVRPEDLATKTHERRDERLRYDRERREQLDQQGYRGDDDQDWRDRVRHDRDRDRSMDRNDDQGSQDRPMHHGRSMDRDGQQGYLRLDVEPSDASVYLDGRFVGTGNDLSQMRGGLPVAPGSHRLAVVRPGHKAEETQFDVKAGQDVKLSLQLEGGSR